MSQASAPPSDFVAPAGPSAWDLYCMQSEVRPEIQADLRRAAAESKIVLLLGPNEFAHQ